MAEDDKTIIGPGNVTLGQVRANIERKSFEVLSDSVRHLVGGCLADTPTQDQTGYMPKKETIFYVDTDAMREVGNVKQANNIDAQKNVMLEARATANNAFDAALNKVDAQTGAKALQVLNYAKEVIYYNNYNNYHTHADRSLQGMNSQSELELSWVKTKLASQLADGSFKKELDALDHSGMSIICEDNSLVR